ncbi:uncharacterized protein I303_105831 [Kwoniella dejecticola CBS 10117]|uniref:Tc1-like transposase DDE domain-containing protein n=1 Tax=Kwoniella dejecticola CBS 10117 TaxID=1296121 RepID=A0AAJ8MIB2_9TREE
MVRTTPRTPTKRGAVIGLHASGLSKSAIAKQLGWPRSTVRDVIQRHLETGSCYDRARSGRPRKTSDRDERLIVRDMYNNHWEPWQFFVERHQLAESTLRGIAMRHGFFKRAARRKVVISKANKAKRQEWARENVGQDWTRVLFTDEASFEAGGLRDRRSPVLRRVGEEYALRNIQPVFRSGHFSVMAWGCIGINRKFPLHFFEPGKIKSARYIDEILKGKLKSYVRRFKGSSNATILVVEDNAPIHNSGVTTLARAKLGIRRLSHPPSSPDLNPIEWMWRAVKRRLGFMPRASNLEMLKEQIREAWEDIPLSYVNGLITRMETVRQAVVAARGLHTPY